jgi:hypothetical protein
VTPANGINASHNPKVAGSNPAPAMSLTLRRGRILWEQRYDDPIWALDTLCTSSDSRMFLANGWELVGRTAGYSRDPKLLLSKRLAAKPDPRRRDNAGLSVQPTSYRWWVWVRRLGSTRSRANGGSRQE